MAGSDRADYNGASFHQRMVSDENSYCTLDTKALAEIRSAVSQQRTLIVPDKDADGLTAGVIIHHTLVTLGLDPSLISVHLVQKGSNIHEELERKAMAETSPKYVIAVDQGSRGGPPVLDSEDAKCMIIDHHLSDEFPEGATVNCELPSYVAVH